MRANSSVSAGATELHDEAPTSKLRKMQPLQKTALNLGYYAIRTQIFGAAASNNAS